MRAAFRSALGVVLCIGLAGPVPAGDMQVAGMTVNVRRGPSTGSAIVGTAARDEVVTVLERAGEWYHVRTRTGLEGYVSAQWLRPLPAATAPAALAPASAPAAAAVPRPSPVPASAPGRVSVAHKDVGCVVAGRFPRLDACFTPAEAVGRAQVQFRADAKGPWYSVDMKSEGTCASALLPKPTRSITSFQYFIEVVDRSFATADKPEAAPAESFTPRVVAREGECSQKMMMAASQPTASVIVTLARDAAGKALQASAQLAGTPSSMVGFSMDGVTMGGATPATGSVGSAEAGKPTNAAHGTHTIAIAGGVAAAAGLVAVVAAASGGSSSGSASGTSGGTSGSSPTTGTTPGSSSSLTGHWVGLAANGDGITYVLSAAGLTCSYTFDITTDLVQSGSSFTGTGTSVNRGINCSVPLPPEVTSVFIGGSGSGSMTGTVNGGGIAFQVGTLPYTGTVTGSRIDAAATSTLEGFTIQSTWRQSKQ